MRQVKIGAILSYLLIVLNAAYGFFVTPFLLNSLGVSSYGVYKTVSAFTSAMMVLDFGLGGTVMRYIAKYRSEDEIERIPGFVSMAFAEALILNLIVILISFVIYLNLGIIFSNSFTSEEINLAEQLFPILVAGIVAHIFENVLNGIITGFNSFIFGNGVKIVRMILRIILIIGFVSIYKDAVILVSIDLVMAILTILVEYLYIRNHFKSALSISFINWDMKIFRESFLYTALLFVTSVVAQINNNLDNVVIGAIAGPAQVAIYSFGILIFGMYQQLSTAISGVMLPTVTQVIKTDSNGHKIQNLIVRAGRIQFLFLGAAVVGFVIIGRQFIQLWLGPNYNDVYVITLILIIPSLFELCVNVCLAVLQAKNMLDFRTIVLVGTTILNLIITIVGVSIWNYFAAAIGTAVSFIIGSLIIMNIYYSKVLHFPMLIIYRRIFKGIWECLLVSGVILLIVSRFTPLSWLGFIGDILAFCLPYCLTLILWGLNKQELQHIPFYNKVSMKSIDS